VNVKALSFSADVTNAGLTEREGLQGKLARLVQSRFATRKAIMNSRNPVLTAEKHHQDWLPFLEFATCEVFQMMLASELTNPESAPTVRFDVTAMVGLAGKLSGMVSIRCQEKTAAVMASRMLGLELDKVGPDISDALGEVCNMVAGNFKNKIAGLGDGCMLSPPSMITGEDYMVHTRPPAPTLEVSLSFEGLPILVTLHIHT
jgi:chemotaxis protein CheX